MSSLFDFFSNIKDGVAGANQLIILVGSVMAILAFLGRKLTERVSLKHLHKKHLRPFFTEDEILRATESYIETKYQNIDPAQEFEPANVHGFAAKQPLIRVLIKKLEAGVADKYYFILGDSGMGKTAFSVNFFLRYSRRIRRKYHIRLYPLGWPNVDKFFVGAEDKEDTILILDAFDEDARATDDYSMRIDSLVENTRSFYAVIITCRTQFFPSSIEEPAKTGILKYGGEKGEHEFKKLYISPFDDSDVKKFIQRKYAFYERARKRQARVIAATCPNLIVRPMVLSFIDDLIDQRSRYDSAYEVYEAIIQRWIRRERVENKAELRRFCESIAVDMYTNQKERKGLFVEGDEMQRFASLHYIRLEEFEMKSRSLLNRDGEGRFKFAHRSIMEYLLALEIIRGNAALSDFDFDRMDYVRGFLKEMILKGYGAKSQREDDEAIRGPAHEEELLLPVPTVTAHAARKRETLDLEDSSRVPAIVCTDIVSSTGLIRRLGTTNSMEVFRAHRDRVRYLATVYNGSAVMSTGDGFMLVFDHVENALNFAAELKRITGHDEISVKIGVHVGKVVIQDGHIAGSALAFAGRLTFAAGDEIYVSDEARRSLGDAVRKPFAWKRQVGVNLRGVGPATVWALTRSA